MSERLATTAGRGALINLAFGVVLQGIVAVQAVLLPRLLGPQVIGLFALATACVALGTTAKNVDLGSKVVQEREVDLQTSYRVAFTLEMAMASAVMVVVVAVSPLIAHLYHRPGLWPLIAVLSLSAFELGLIDLPASVAYREMRYARRSLLTSTGPVTTFVVSVALAYAGLGVWALAAGALSGLAVAAVVTVWGSPIKPAFVLDRAVTRRFLSFGWPVWTQGLLTTVTGWGTVIFISSLIGISGLGYFELAQNWAGAAIQVDGYLSDALFPALCSVQASRDRLRSVFVITNRLSMLWAGPVGFALLILARPGVELILGSRWLPAVVLVRAEGVGIVLHAIGLNWRLFYTSRGQTKPLMVAGGAMSVGLLVLVIPLTAAWRLNGAAGAIVALAVFGTALRQVLVGRLLGPINFVTLCWREILAAGVGGGALELARSLGWAASSLPMLFAQGAALLVVSGSLAALFDRGLVRETWRILRGGSTAETPSASGPDGRFRSLPAGRRGSFPMFIEADPDGRHLWVGTRDWPAVGQFDPTSGVWSWAQVPSYPHSLHPDGIGGCWTALTRSRRIVRVAEGRITDSIPVPGAGPELLVSCVQGTTVWTVDARERCLWHISMSGEAAPRRLELPNAVRPDFVVEGPGHQLWVGDTARASLIVIEASGALRDLPAPHAVRGMAWDRRGAGCWIGGSSEPVVSLVGGDGEHLFSRELESIPFGIAQDGAGRLYVALRDRGAVAVLDEDGKQVGLLELGPDSAPIGVTVPGDTCWVTLSGTSEVVGLPLGGGDGPSAVSRRAASEEPVLHPDEPVVVPGE